MTTAAKYHITTDNRVIHVNLTGDWHPAIDLIYMHELADTIRRVNNKKWALMIDFSDCHIHANNIVGAYAQTSLKTDRRNQQLEVWIVDRPDQGDFLLNFGSTRDAKIHKCFSTPEAINTN